MQQKAMWDENVVPLCQLCGEPDTREHRLLTCATLHEVRQQHVEACEILQHVRPEWCYLPLPRLFDEVNILRAFTATIRLPDLEPPYETGLTHLRFFMDGGAIHPTYHVGRLAAWAVIQDLSTSDTARRMSVDFLYVQPPRLPFFRVAAMGLVSGEQTVATGELQALVCACQIAHKSPNMMTAEFVTDASYVCAVVRLIELGIFSCCLHKLPNSDLILQLHQLWRPETFLVKKVKSHRRFDEARDLHDLWYIAGNFCADMVVGLTFQTVPSCIRQCAEDAVKFQKNEETMLKRVFHYMAQLNKIRCEQLNQSASGKGHTTKLQLPRLEQERVIGTFDSQAYGQEALKWLCNFEPEGYAIREPIECDIQVFQMVLQGPRLGIAIKQWVETLRWPSDIDNKDPQDWGISWFEMMMSFYLFTGLLFPVTVSGAGARAKYIPYHSDEATLLPPSKRSGAQQALCFRNVIQNLTTLLGERFFPTFDGSKCSSMYRLGWRNECAGITRRPILPNNTKTMMFIQQYLEKLDGVRALANPIFQKDLVAQVVIPHVDEDDVPTRFQKYMAFMKVKRRGN